MLPDKQVKPGVDTSHLGWIGNYIVEKRPDVIADLGDHYDFPSLSRHDDGKAELDDQDVADDYAAGNDAFRKLQAPIDRYNKGRRNKYSPRKEYFFGNHDVRPDRFLEASGHRRFKKMLSRDNMALHELGWRTHEFLKPVNIGGVWFAHYFYAPLSGKPYGGTCANKLKNIGHSFVMGHQQGLDVATRTLPNGQMQWGLVAGSCYLHDEDYKGPQANGHWRGIVMLHEVENGSFDPMFVSLDYLKRRYS